ncbi:MAG TPA: hypothetical protein VGG33_23575 [Polyangia bacterium]
MLLRWLLLVTVTVACNGNGRSTADGDARDASPPSGDDAAETLPPTLMECAETAAKASALVRPALDRALADAACIVDEDCLVAAVVTQCTATCGIVFSRSGLASMEATLAQVNADVCTGFLSSGCVLTRPPCGGTATRQAACVQGQCADFPPARWRSITITKPAGRICEGTGCSAWQLNADGTLLRTAEGRTTELPVAPSDFAIVDELVRSVAFREGQRSGFGCDPRPMSGVVDLSVQRDSLTTGYDVSSCVVEGATNAPARLHTILTKH